MSAAVPDVPIAVIPQAPHKRNISSLYDFELDYLIQAIRRDLQAETDRITSDPLWADSHRFNVRHAIRMLEILNPKARTIGGGHVDY